MLLLIFLIVWSIIFSIFLFISAILFSLALLSCRFGVVGVSLALLRGCCYVVKSVSTTNIVQIHTERNLELTLFSLFVLFSFSILSILCILFVFFSFLVVELGIFISDTELSRQHEITGCPSLYCDRER